MKPVWGFIGCGHLAQALILGALEKKVLKPSQVLITNRKKNKSVAFKKQTGVQIAKNNQELIANSKIIFLGTKPFDIFPVLTELSQNSLNGKIIISLAAGVPSQILKDFCGPSTSLFRVMANTPATLQKGIFGIFPIRASKSQKTLIFNFFKKLGYVINLKDDKDVDIITSACASGVGFIFLFMEQFEKWILKKGLPAKEAKALTLQTFLGASQMVEKNSTLLISDLRRAVTSKKGTTLAGLKAMEKAMVKSGLKSGLEQAFNRSREIAKSLLQSAK